MSEQNIRHASDANDVSLVLVVNTRSTQIRVKRHLDPQVSESSEDNLI